MTGDADPVDFEFTVFMLVRADPDRSGLAVAFAREWAQEVLAPILQKNASRVTLGYFDLEYDPARITDIWIWRAKDGRAFRHLLADLKEDQFWNSHFRVVELYAGVEEAHARSYYRTLIPTYATMGRC